MIFRVTATIHKFCISTAELPVFLFTEPRKIELTVENHSPEKIKGSEPSFYFISKCETNPKSDVQSIFKAFSENKVPNQIKPSDDLLKNQPIKIEEDGHFKAVGTFPIELTPDYFKSFVNTVTNDLISAIKRTVRLLRWRFNIKSPYRPFKFFETEYSFDGDEWFKMPGGSPRFMFESISVPHITDSKRDVIVDLFDKGFDEPLGFELLLEAKELESSNPRLSIILSIVALETGIKDFIYSKEPATKWLLENLQSPPILKIIKEYIPIYYKNRLKKGETFLLPKEYTQTLKKSVTIRNQIVHGASPNFSDYTVCCLLEITKSLLLFFEFLKGNNWVLTHIRVNDNEFAELLEEKFI